MDITVIDNFLEKKYLEKIQSTMFDNNFPWYLALVLSDKNYNDYNTLENKKNSLHLSHVFYYNMQPSSSFINLVEPIIEKVNPLAIIKIKSNLNFKTEKNTDLGMHNDTKYLCKTSVFYVNNNNGYTIFEDGTKIYSKENRIVIFDSDKKHSGFTCTDKNFRCVINLNYVERKEYE